jgi:hypothetical protein
MPVYDQKSFYRKLDSLLSKIEIVSGGDRVDILATVMHDLVESFGVELSIRNGRLYEVAGDERVLRPSSSSSSINATSSTSTRRASIPTSR